MARRDEAEFREFAVATQGQLRRTAFLVCGDHHRAADIVQEALIRVYVAWPRLDHGESLRAYARRAVVNVAIDTSRRRSSTERVGVHEADRPVDEDLAGRVAQREALLHALSVLPPRQRACVVLRYLDDLSVADVASALGCSEGTVKSQTARGLEALRQAYRSQQGLELLAGEAGAP